jgi:hypothetical protein
VLVALAVVCLVIAGVLLAISMGRVGAMEDREADELYARDALYPRHRLGLTHKDAPTPIAAARGTTRKVSS